MRPIIAVIGEGWLAGDDPRRGIAESIGKGLIDNGYRLLSGGLGGVMESASRGAHRSRLYREGDVIGILPMFDSSHANEYVDTPIATGLDVARNVVVANSDAVIAVGGGVGTLSEMSIAWALNRLIIAMRVEGWSGKVADTRLDSKVRCSLKDDKVYGADDADEAMDLLQDLLPHYNRRFAGIKTIND